MCAAVTLSLCSAHWCTVLLGFLSQAQGSKAAACVYRPAMWLPRLVGT